MELVFTQDKETKKKFRFSLEGDGPVVGGLYVDKKLAEKVAPDGKLLVTIDAIPAEGATA